eukprot:15000-Prymnesium_polylepis.1
MICASCDKSNQIRIITLFGFCAGPAACTAATTHFASVQGSPIRYLARRRCALQRTLAATQQETR